MATIRSFKTRKAQLAYCAKRDTSLYSFYLKGWSQRELSEKYQITTQRVGQIIAAQERAARKSKKKAS